MLKLLLFFFLILIYDIHGQCGNTDNYDIEILFILDGTPDDVDSTQWASQIDAVNSYISEMKNSTKVAVTQMGQQFGSMPTYTTVSELKSQSISLTQDTQYTNRNPAFTVNSAINNGFTESFEQQKLIIIFTAGEITATGAGTNFCLLNTALKSKLIEVIVIGIGTPFYDGIGSDASDGYAQLQFQCLLKDNQETDDSINKGLYIVSDFNQLTSITSNLKDNYFCMADTNTLFVITEIRPSSASNHFIEILNYGRPFTTSEIIVSGTILVNNGGISGGTILQGQMLVISNSVETQCTNCVETNIAALLVQTTGWLSTSQSGWSITVTIGGTSISITHSTSNHEWWIADTNESYELFILGGNEQFSDNWISSYNQNEGTPGGYGYKTGETRRTFTQLEGSTKCFVTSQNGNLGTCSDCYNPTNNACDCGGLSNEFTINFYSNSNDPTVCRRLPLMSSSYGCRVFPKGSGIDEEFRFGTVAPNTDMNFWFLYIEYPHDTTQSTIYFNLLGPFSYQSIVSSLSQPITGYDATQDTTPSNSINNKIGVTNKQDGSNVGETIQCGFVTGSPTMKPTNEPTTTPTGIPTGTPTKRPTSGTPIIRLETFGCSQERCGCPISFVDCPSDQYPPLIEELRSVSTDQSLEITQSIIEVLDGIFFSDALFDVPVEVNWRIVFLNICASNQINTTSPTLDCLKPITTKEELALSFNPPLDVNDSSNANFTFTSDITITPMNGTVNVTGTGINRVGGIVITEFKENTFLNPNTFLSGIFRARFLLELVSCNQVPSGGCNIGYPSQYIFSYEIGKQPDGGTRQSNEIPTWIWWIIIPLIIFLIIIALLVYKYWWKKRKTDEELKKEQDDLDDIVKENELGFAHDLDTGNIANNPLAKVNPALTGPVNPQHVDPTQKQNQRIDEVARVRVEQFQVRQEYGQTQQQRNIVPQNSYDPY